MSKKIPVVWYWALALVVTLSAAIYQRRTGPTYPKRIEIGLSGQTYKLKLPRSHEQADCPVRLPIADATSEGELLYRRYPAGDAWDTLTLRREGAELAAQLPQQPPAGKLAYRIHLRSGTESVRIGDDEPVVIRFKGNVPGVFLAPHVFFMFAAMLLSTLSGLLALAGRHRQVIYGRVTFVLLLIGGMILGPVVQLYAFGDLWTGIPFGWDLTDNKTLVAFLFWTLALVANLRRERHWATVLAAVVLLLIYSIPHSLYGSELDYESGKVIQGLIVPLW